MLLDLLAFLLKYNRAKLLKDRCYVHKICISKKDQLKNVTSRYDVGTYPSLSPCMALVQPSPLSASMIENFSPAFIDNAPSEFAASTL